MVKAQAESGEASVCAKNSFVPEHTGIPNDIEKSGISQTRTGRPEMAGGALLHCFSGAGAQKYGIM